MKAKTVEDLLNDQIAACVAATEDCLAQSRVVRAESRFGSDRHNEIAYVAMLMKASARLTEALASLRGERLQTIRVQRETVPQPDKGGGG